MNRTMATTAAIKPEANLCEARLAVSWIKFGGLQHVPAGSTLIRRKAEGLPYCEVVHIAVVFVSFDNARLVLLCDESVLSLYHQAT